MVSSKPSQRHSHQSESYVDRREIIEEIIIVTKCGMRVRVEDLPNMVRSVSFLACLNIVRPN